MSDRYRNPFPNSIGKQFYNWLIQRYIYGDDEGAGKLRFPFISQICLVNFKQGFRSTRECAASRAGSIRSRGSLFARATAARAVRNALGMLLWHMQLGIAGPNPPNPGTSRLHHNQDV